MSEPDYNELLIDVRHAWKIVAAYQQRVFFLLDEFRAGFPELGMTFWEPAHFSRPPRGTTIPMKKWSWDGLPYYCMDNWFILDNGSADNELKAGDWFMVVRVFADDSFDRDTAQTSAFSGPDPISMPAAEESSSSIYVYLYHVHLDADITPCPGEVWEADMDLDTDPEKWDAIASVSCSRIYWHEALGNVFAEGGTAILIQKVRESLKSRGVI